MFWNRLRDFFKPQAPVGTKHRRFLRFEIKRVRKHLVRVTKAGRTKTKLSYVIESESHKQALLILIAYFTKRGYNITYSFRHEASAFESSVILKGDIIFEWSNDDYNRV